MVSSSANCAEVLGAAGIADLFDLRIDGVAAAARQLRGKPAPDTYLAAAAGVDRVGQAVALRNHGVDVVVSDLAQLLDQT